MSVRETVPRSGANEATQAMDLSEVRRATLPRPRIGGSAQADDEATVVTPASATEAPALRQPSDAEATTVLQGEPDTVIEDPATARQRRRAERDRALGTKRRLPEPEPEQVKADKPKLKRSTDKFLGSLGLFLLRLVTAGIIGLHGFAKMLDIGAVQTMLRNTVIPEPVIMSYVLAGAEVAIALALVVGLFTRLAGLGLAAIGICALVFVRWVTNPFVGNTLTGELELLLGAVGLLFVSLGAGGWSVDAAFRRRRAAEKA